MRIISGKYGRRKINQKLPAGIRPTTDSCKETIFNIVNNMIDLSGISVLDLFAGSGLLGMEALSRGANHCTFTDKSFKSVQYIKSIADYLNVPEEAYQVIKIDAKKYLNAASENKLKFDLIFVDPPYSLSIVNDISTQIVDKELLSDSGILVIESPLEISGVNINHLEHIYHKIFGETKIDLLRLMN